MNISGVQCKHTQQFQNDPAPIDAPACISRTPGDGLPVELVFSPEWWYKHYGVQFDEAFFFDPGRRVKDERLMRKALAERFPKLYGHYVDEKRPTIGPLHLASGFVMSQIWGCKVNFRKSSPPEVIPRNLTDDEFFGIEMLDLEANPVMTRLQHLIDTLVTRFGYVEGDFNVGGVLNLALDLRGQSLYLDFYDNPEAVDRFLGIIAESLAGFFEIIKEKTGTTSVSINRSIMNLDPSITIHGNCSVQMISPEIYERFLLKHELMLSERFQPYGIHHCGSNMHEVARSYAKVKGSSFFDVGWGSDIHQCRQALPNAFLNLRYSPVNLARQTANEVCSDLQELVKHAAPYDRVGICCINIDDTVCDENVRVLVDFAQSYKW